uniref:Uncharacterized protein n=2 Tax=Oryza TaxID=4527 RepID=A0A679BEB9_ORYNI|nr:hypothetical protein [Oryza sativa Indica Group]BBF89929.1 hypothetical protein [Oryza sativa f. spontanea]
MATIKTPTEDRQIRVLGWSGGGRGRSRGLEGWLWGAAERAGREAPMAMPEP